MEPIGQRGENPADRTSVLRDRRSAVPEIVVARIEGRATRTRKDGATGYFPALNAYAIFVACSIVVLICSGGMVTSKGAGLAVPNWPNSYGYNMFAFPGVALGLAGCYWSTRTGWQHRRKEFSSSVWRLGWRWWRNGAG